MFRILATMGSSHSLRLPPNAQLIKPRTTGDLYEEYLETNLAACVRNGAHKAHLEQILTGLDMTDTVGLVNRRLEFDNFHESYRCCTPLAYAIAEDDADLVQMLVKFGADLTCKPCFLKPDLVREGGDMDVYDVVSPMHFACVVKCNIKIVQILLEAGAPLGLISNDGFSPILQYASMCSDLKVLHFLIGEALIGPSENRNNNLIDAKDTQGRCILHHAARNHNRVVSELMIENDISVNIRDNAGCTPLMLAVEHNDRKLVGILLDCGADLFAQDNSGKGVIHYALKHPPKTDMQRRRKANLLKTLLAQIAWPQFEPNDLASAFEFLLECFPLEDVVKLLEVNVDKLTGADQKGKTLLHHAAKETDNTMLKWLLDNCPAIQLSPSQGLVVSDASSLSLDSSINAFINATDDDGFTPVMVAASMGNLEAVEYLVRAGADTFHCSDSGWSPLWCALRHGWQNIAAYLIRQGCNIDHPISLEELRGVSSHVILSKSILRNCHQGVTPVEYAIHMQYFTNAFILALAGCNTESRNVVSMDGHEITTGPRVVTKDKIIIQCIKNDQLSKAIVKTLTSLTELFKRPKTLKELDRIALRKELGGHVLEKVQLLPIDDDFRRYICIMDNQELTGL